MLSIFKTDCNLQDETITQNTSDRRIYNMDIDLEYNYL